MESTAENAFVRDVADEEIARRVLSGERDLFELLMRRHNQRVYRAVRGLIRDEAEVEDVMQQAYVSAYVNLAGFRGSSKFSTWLVRIAMNEALMRLRRTKRIAALADQSGGDDAVMERNGNDPESVAERREMLGILEKAIDDLPDIYRSVLLLRDVEGLSTAECAEALETSEDVVKTRLHRAKAHLRERIAALAETQVNEVFPFHAPRCDRVVRRVMERIATL